MIYIQSVCASHSHSNPNNNELIFGNWLIFVIFFGNLVANMVDAVELGRNSAFYCGSFSLKTFPSEWIISQNQILASPSKLEAKLMKLFSLEHKTDCLNLKRKKGRINIGKRKHCGAFYKYIQLFTETSK